MNLTEQQKKNLLVFLSRVDLKGQEAPEFMELVKALNEQEPKKEEAKKDK